MSDGASRRSTMGAPTRTGQALLGSLGALSNPSAAGAGGLDISRKNEDNNNNNNNKEGEERKPVNKFSAAKLMSIVQETSAPSISRLRKNADKDATTEKDNPPAAAAAAAAEEDGPINANSASRRRTPTRTMSAQNPRVSSRRLRAADQNLDDSFGDDDEGTMDGSYMGGSAMDRSVSSSASGRRRLPQRSRSGGLPGLEARPPRSGRRRPERVEEVDEGEISPRRSRPLRAKSADEVPRAYQQRARRPNRRKPGREDDSDSDGIDYSEDEESVEISDSDIEAERDEENDRSMSQSSRRKLPARSRSVQESRHTDRLERRRARRRGTNGDDEDEGSPRRPQIQRSNTTGGGPNPRGARARGARNTAAELAVVATRERERQERQQREREYSPEPSVNEKSVHGSVSPIKSRQERRRMREEKEREGMERRMTMGSMGSVVPEKPKKKEEPWMRRRLQKASGEDSFNAFDDAFSADGFNDSGTADDGFNFDAFTQQSAIPKLEKPRK